jgi:hypothetical protein
MGNGSSSARYRSLKKDFAVLDDGDLSPSCLAVELDGAAALLGAEGQAANALPPRPVQHPEVQGSADPSTFGIRVHE